MGTLRTTLILMLTLVVSLLYSQDKSWQDVTAGNSPLQRSENAYVQVGDKFYLVGGRGLKPVEIFDPVTRKWTKGAQPPFEMHHFQALAYKGLLYVVGAFNGPWPFETPIPNILIYDPAIDQWAIGPKIPSHRQRGAAGVALYNDKIYLVCGIVNGHTSGWVPWLDEFDPATNSWNVLPDAPRARDHFQAAVIEGKLYAAGGRHSGKGSGFEATIGPVDVYDFVSEKWSTLPSPQGDIPTQRAGCTAVVSGKDLIIIGGESGSQVPAHSEAEVLNTANHTWSALPKLIQGRHGTQAILTNNTLFIAAGCGNRGGSPELSSQEMYGALPENFAEPVKKGSLGVSQAEYTFRKDGSSKQTAGFTVTNTGGNQGLLVNYASITGGSDFAVDLPYTLPYVIQPGNSLTLKVTYTVSGGKKAEGVLHIKTLGKEKPVEVKLTAE
jgi:hypothetical protein